LSDVPPSGHVAPGAPNSTPLDTHDLTTADDPNDAYIVRICITRDKGFLEASLPGLIGVVSPSEWIVEHLAESRKRMMRQLGQPRPR
jgi:hypothetical protein